MDPLASFAFLMTTVQRLVDAVRTRDDLHIRPPLARKSVAVRLASGLRLLRAFLRRLIILIALEMEWGLVDMRGPMKRPRDRKSKSSRSFSFKSLDANKARAWLYGERPISNRGLKAEYNQAHYTPIQIDMAKLYAHLDYLSKIAANPTAKAKRLAFHLARSHQGIIMAPEGPRRVAGRWGTQVRASYEGMAASIMTTSRNRPPPLPPPRTHWPSVTAL